MSKLKIRLITLAIVACCLVATNSDAGVLSGLQFGDWEVRNGGRLFCTGSVSFTINPRSEPKINNYIMTDVFGLGWAPKANHGWDLDESGLLGSEYPFNVASNCPNHDPSMHRWKECIKGARSQKVSHHYSQSSCVQYNGSQRKLTSVLMCEAYLINGVVLVSDNNCFSVPVPETEVSCAISTNQGNVTVEYDGISRSALRAGLVANRNVTLTCEGGADATVRVTPPKNGISLDSKGKVISKIDVGSGDGQPKNIQIGEGKSTTLPIIVTTVGDGIGPGNYSGSGVITISVQ